MLAYPQIDPVAIALGPLKIHWYGLMYLIGIGGAWLLASRRLKAFDPAWTKDKLSDLVFWVAMGVILGGRFGYVLFYNFGHFLSDPLSLFKVWEGGMSFHGGFIGVMLATWWFGRRNGKTFFELMDLYRPSGSDWPGRRPSGQLHQRRAVGQGHRCALGDGLPHRSRRSCRVIPRSCTSSRWRAWRCL